MVDLLSPLAPSAALDVYAAPDVVAVVVPDALPSPLGEHLSPQGQAATVVPPPPLMVQSLPPPAQVPVAAWESVVLQVPAFWRFLRPNPPNTSLLSRLC